MCGCARVRAARPPKPDSEQKFVCVCVKLDMQQIKAVMNNLPPKHQTLLFSATMPKVRPMPAVPALMPCQHTARSQAVDSQPTRVAARAACSGVVVSRTPPTLPQRLHRWLARRRRIECVLHCATVAGSQEIEELARAYLNKPVTVKVCRGP